MTINSALFRPFFDLATQSSDPGDPLPTGGAGTARPIDEFGPSNDFQFGSLFHPERGPADDPFQFELDGNLDSAFPVLE